MGVSLRANGDDYAEMTSTIDKCRLNCPGGAHGDLISALVDKVGFFPKLLLSSGLRLMTVNLSVSYLRLAKPCTL